METTNVNVKYKINEIFSSIEGEGKRTGRLCTFIRLFGCNLRCAYPCDTMYAVEGNDFKELTVDEIMQQVKTLGNKCITITGGEPLLHNLSPLMKALTQEGCEINIETNGSIALRKYQYDKGDVKMFYTMDWKCPSSGMNDKMSEDRLFNLSKDDVLKFVVGTQEDLEELEHIYRTHKCLAKFYVSPVFGKMEGKTIIEFMKEHHLEDVYVQCQLHKIYYDPKMRGV